MNDTPPPGWYPNGDGRRYWDGSAWTEQFEPTATSKPAAPVKDADAIWQVVGKPIAQVGAGRYKLTEHYLFFEKGMLRTDSQQVPIANVLDVDIKQSMTQKARQVASIRVHIQRPNGVEIVLMEDVPDFREGQRLINETAHEARRTLQRNANTHRYEGTHPQQVPAPAVTPPPAAAPAADPIQQLEQLGRLRDADVLSEEEFASKKAEILSRL